MRTIPVVGILVLVPAVAASCGGSSAGDGSSGGAPLPLDQFAERAAAAVCNTIAPCCGAQGIQYDDAACKAGWKGFYDEWMIEPVKAGLVKYDENAAGGCMAWMETRSCTAPTDSPEACAQAFQGTKNAGEACTTEMECISPPGGFASCGSGPGGTAGTCVQEPRGKVGDVCGGTCTDHGDGSISCSVAGTEPPGTSVANCFTNDGLYCDGTCKALAVIGAPCTADGCVEGAFCANDVCMAKQPIGGECGLESDACGDDAFCDTNATGKCTAKKAAGAPCVSWDECQGTCNDGVCEPDGTGLVSKLTCTGALPY